MVRLVILGGSGSATPELAEALAAWPGGVERRPPLEIVLHARSAEKLSLVSRELRRRLAAAGVAAAGAQGGPDVENANGGAAIAVITQTDRRAALEGADAVVNAVRIGGLAARTFDETFPRAFGIPGEETMGPGGFANALRTVPALRSTWQDVAGIAPDAIVLNLTNPSGIVVAAGEREWGLRIVSLCDSPTTHCEAIAERLGQPVEAIRERYLGMNHVGWWVPSDDVELDTVADLAVGLDRGAVDAHGALGSPYMRYYAHPDRILTAQRAAGETRAEQLLRLERELMDGYARGVHDLPRRGAAWYTKAVLPFLDAWWNGSTGPLTVGLRHGGWIAGLATSVVTEGPVAFPAPRTMRPLPVPPVPLLPTPAASLLARHAAYESLTVEALLAGSPRRLLVRALLANPMVGSFDAASGLVDAILARSPS